MEKKLTKPAAFIRQGNLTILTTSLKVSELLSPNFYNIDRLDPENANEKGFQRLLNKGRAKKLADYIIRGQETQDAFLPTSILMATDKVIAFNEENNTIEIDIDKICPFNVVDGQHRIEGLKIAAEKDSRVLDFEVPVNIAVNLDNIAQMAHFLIVNTTQKSVDEGLAQRIRERLTDLIDIEKMPTLPHWIQNMVTKGEDKAALRFVDFLNNKEGSPWMGKITMANENNKTKQINQKSFVSLLKKHFIVIDNPITEGGFAEDKQLAIFLNYWKALENIINPDSSSVFYKYNSVYLFSKFSVSFFNKLVNMQNFTVETMQNILQDVFDNADGEASGIGHIDYWATGGKAGGLNAGALSKVCASLTKSLHSTGNQSREILV